MTEKAPVTATASTATVQSAAAKGSMMSKQAILFDILIVYCFFRFFKIGAHNVTFSFQLNRGYKMVHNAVVAANDARELR